MIKGQPITIVPSGYMQMKDKTLGLADRGEAILAYDKLYDQLCEVVTKLEIAKKERKEGQDVKVIG